MPVYKSMTNNNHDKAKDEGESSTANMKGIKNLLEIIESKAEKNLKLMTEEMEPE